MGAIGLTGRIGFIGFIGFMGLIVFTALIVLIAEGFRFFRKCQGITASYSTLRLMVFIS